MPTRAIAKMLTVFAVVSSVAHLFSRRMIVPIIHGDEAGYLANAQHIAHKTISGSGVTGEGYLAGYSLLLSPIAFVSASPHHLYTFSLVVNAFLLGLTAVCVAYIVRSGWPRLSDMSVLLITGVSVAAPGLVGLTGFVLADNALMAIVAVSAALSLFALRAESRMRAEVAIVLAGITAGFAPAVNPRGLVVFVAWTIVAIFILRRPRLQWRVVASGASGAVSLLGRVFNDRVLGDSATSTPGAGIGLRSYLDHITDVSLWPGIVSDVAGRFAYTSATTFGLAWIGIAVVAIAAYRGLRTRNRTRDGERDVMTASSFVALAFLTTLGLSSLDTAPPELVRIDFLIYGRYIEYYLPILTAIGLAWVWSRPVRSRVRVAGAVVASTFGAVLVARALAPVMAEGAWLNPVNVLYIEAVSTLSNRGIYATLLVGVLLMAAVWLALAYSPTVGSVVALVTLLSLSWTVYDSYLLPGTQQRAEEAVLAGHLVHLEAGVADQCVAIDWPGNSEWHVRNTQVFANQYVYVDDLDNTCSLVLTPLLDLDAEFDGARVIGSENHHEVRLWWRPTEDLTLGQVEYLDSRSFADVPPTGIYVREAYEALLDVEVAEASGGDSLTIDVTLTHAGLGSPWLGAYAELGRQRVSRTLLLIDYGTGEDRRQVRVDTPRSMLPGDSVTVRVSLSTSGLGDELEVSIDVLQERVTRFSAVTGHLPRWVLERRGDAWVVRR